MNALLALPALLGQTSLTSPATVQFINLALGIVVHGVAVAERLSALNDEVAYFVKEGRDPTAEEFAAMAGRVAAAGGDLRDAVNEQLGDA